MRDHHGEVYGGEREKRAEAEEVDAARGLAPRKSRMYQESVPRSRVTWRARSRWQGVTAERRPEKYASCSERVVSPGSDHEMEAQVATAGHATRPGESTTRWGRAGAIPVWRRASHDVHETREQPAGVGEKVPQSTQPCRFLRPGSASHDENDDCSSLSRRPPRARAPASACASTAATRSPACSRRSSRAWGARSGVSRPAAHRQRE